MKKVRYSVATSLDGFIAGPNGEHDWIAVDPEIDFGAISARFDTLFVGRKSYEPMAGGETDPDRGMFASMRTMVFSTTLDPDAHPGVEIVRDDVERAVEEARARSGKDIWLFGGGELFRSLAVRGLVDAVDVAVIPVMLGAGVPLLPPAERRVELELKSQRALAATGTLMLEYDVRARG